MDKLFSVGDILYGYCNGFFGRDDYNKKVCLMVTPRFAVFQFLNGTWEGHATVLNMREGLTPELTDQWKIPDEDEDY